jgi:hypothetical protein
MRPLAAHQRKSLLAILVDIVTSIESVDREKRTMEFGATILDEGVEDLGQDPVRKDGGESGAMNE